MKRVLVLALVILFSVGALADTVTTGTVYVRSGGGTLHLRAGMDTKSESLGFVKHGDEVIVHGTQDGWSYITVSRTGLKGYIRSAYIKDLKTSSGEEGQMAVTDIAFDAVNALMFEAPGEFTVDLNADGVVETFRVEIDASQEGSEKSVISVWAANGSNDTVETDMASGLSVWFARMGADLRVYAFVSGDVMSDDYYTQCLYWDGAKIQFVPIYCPAPYQKAEGEASGAPGAVDWISGDSIVISTTRDALGTWGASYQYAMNAGRIDFVPGDVWRIKADLSNDETWSLREVVVKSPVPATVYGAACTLQIGTALMPTAIDDAASRVYFVTSAGDAGYFDVTHKEDEWGNYIAGVREEEYFENLMYAG